MCGHSLEMNATSDIDFFLSTTQVQLMLHILTSNFAALLSSHTRDELCARARPKDVLSGVTRRDDTYLNDSGMGSETSTFVTLVPKQQDSSTSDTSTVMPQFTPFDVLLTAGKISFMVYSHSDSDTVRTPSIRPSCKIVRSKTDLELKSDAQSTLSSLDSGLESMAENVANITVSTSNSQPRIVPFLYAQFSQPHSLVSCQSVSQKVELSCYDIVIKGSKPGYMTGGQYTTTWGLK